jgi:hypothetical protein
VQWAKFGNRHQVTNGEGVECAGQKGAFHGWQDNFSCTFAQWGIFFIAGTSAALIVAQDFGWSCTALLRGACPVGKSLFSLPTTPYG